MVEAELKEWGNSIGIIVPADEVRSLNLHKGDRVEINIIKKERVEGFGICKGAPLFKEEKEYHGEFW